jgi:hypothetical protein
VNQSADVVQTGYGFIGLSVTIWARVHGLVSLEIGDQYPPYMTELEEVYRVEMKRIAASLFRASLSAANLSGKRGRKRVGKDAASTGPSVVIRQLHSTTHSVTHWVRNENRKYG